MAKISVGIVGGAGMTGGELLRLLLNHPNTELKFIHSRSQAGAPISNVHSDLTGESDLTFTDTIEKVDVMFLCLGHGESRVFLEANPVDQSTIVIDLSQDFRLEDGTVEGRNMQLGNRQFVYGLPEMQKDKIQQASNIANPGCFATAIQLALVPLAAAGKLNSQVHISAITGSTGAGLKPQPTTGFSWRNNNISSYKVFKHQHLYEITQSLKSLQPDFEQSIKFVPYRGNFSRGILASVYLESDLSEEEAVAIYQQHYSDHPFTFLIDKEVDLKLVVNTNKCLLRVEKHDDTLLITSAIDNLLKGAVGQAVQNMNLIFGLEESTGLKLKPIAF
ncbi:N-acetyl-gamma-glutamyl-phosphate reductase [Limibacter armeniacum]|uniref:N-acetyl-gamma-glutamyl-phosphate reductase n=1 Tax=Limibacter armeniacum TaxID=466084 RepID=UPI002FE62428